MPAKSSLGNPAAVCPLKEWIPDDIMQAVAAENNLAETAFFVGDRGSYKLRWFTPQSEVQLCGHATLASGFVLLNILDPSAAKVSFETLSGRLTVEKDGDLLLMDLPSMPPWKATQPPADLFSGLSANDTPPVDVQQVKSNYFVVYANEQQVRNVRPNFSLLEKLHPFGVCITAPGDEVDFVSRYFAPSYGIPEDPVTGSTHSSLIPYWTQRLHKKQLVARQLSKRGGEIQCELSNDRVLLKGSAVLYLKGSIWV